MSFVDAIRPHEDPRLSKRGTIVNVELIWTRCFLLDLLYIFVVVAIVVFVFVRSRMVNGKRKCIAKS